MSTERDVMRDSTKSRRMYEKESQRHHQKEHQRHQKEHHRDLKENHASENECERNTIFSVDYDLIRGKDGHYIQSGKGLFGQYKKENKLISLGQATPFPSWDVLTKAKYSKRNSLKTNYGNKIFFASNEKICSSFLHMTTTHKMKSNDINNNDNPFNIDEEVIFGKEPNIEVRHTDVINENSVNKNKTNAIHENLDNTKEANIINDNSSNNSEANVVNENSVNKNKGELGIETKIEIHHTDTTNVIAQQQTMCEGIKCLSNNATPSTEMYRNVIKSLGSKYVNKQRRSSDSDILCAVGGSPGSFHSTPKQVKRRVKSDRISSDSRNNGPSHYKGKRRGTYVACYDPHITAMKPRSRSRSRSLFILNDENLKKDINSRLLNTKITGNDKSLSKFAMFVSQHGSHLAEHDLSSIRDGKKYLPTIKNGRRISVTKANSFSSRNTVWNIKEAKNRCILPNKQELSGDHWYDSESIIIPSNNIASVSKMNQISNVSKSYEEESNLVTCYGRRKERTQSSFEGAPKEYLMRLQKKYEHARKRSEKNKRSASTNSSDDCTIESTDIHEAVKQGNTLKLQELIAIGQDVNVLDKQGFPPCHYALITGRYECIAILLTAGANIKEYFDSRRLRYFR